MFSTPILFCLLKTQTPVPETLFPSPKLKLAQKQKPPQLVQTSYFPLGLQSQTWQTQNARRETHRFDTCFGTYARNVIILIGTPNTPYLGGPRWGAPRSRRPFIERAERRCAERRGPPGLFQAIEAMAMGESLLCKLAF